MCFYRLWIHKRSVCLFVCLLVCLFKVINLFKVSPLFKTKRQLSINTSEITSSLTLDPEMIEEKS